jgi:hypothetical protein
MPKKRELNSPTFREMDDKLVAAIKLLDITLSSMLKSIVSKHKEFMIDTLMSIIRSLDDYAGGIRLIANSRKKETSKLAILELLTYVDKPDSFIRHMNILGLSRRARHTILITYITALSKNYLTFLKLYKDPTPTYTTIIPIVHAYNNVRKQIVGLTVRYLSKTVLSKYSGWVLKRSISSSLDYISYEEDIQNSIFYIEKALGLFNTKMHKSFFSYASWWIRYGIKNTSFSLDKKDGTIFQEYTDEMDVHLEKVIEIDEDQDDRHTYQLLPELLKGSLPLSIELRILSLLS